MASTLANPFPSINMNSSTVSTACGMEPLQQRFYIFGHLLASARTDKDMIEGPSTMVRFKLSRWNHYFFTALVTDIPYTINHLAQELEVEVKKDGLGLDEDGALHEAAFKIDGNLYGQSLLRAFLKGVFHAAGTLTYNVENDWVCTMRFLGDTTYVARYRMLINTFLPIPIPSNDANVGVDKLEFVGTNAVDFAGWLLGDSDTAFIRWANLYEGNRSSLSGSTMAGYHGCVIERTLPDAVLPYKTHSSDVGYDLTLLRVHKELSPVCTLYDTGIRIQNMPTGLYVEIAPRSSLSKSGYMIANSIGIIDPSYRNNLYVALIKVDPNAPPIQLPFRAAQLIFRHHVFVSMLPSTDERIIGQPMGDAMTTARGLGGFGSTSDAAKQVI